MSRYYRDLPIAAPPEAVFNYVHQYLMSEGYEYTQYENETVFKKGMGLVSCPTFIKLSFYNNIVRIEAWVKYALFPGVYVGEYGITGFFLWAVKGPLKTRVSMIENAILQYFSVPAPTDQPPVNQ